MTMELLGKICGTLFSFLIISSVIVALYSWKYGVELSSWLYTNRRDKSKAMSKLFGIDLGPSAWTGLTGVRYVFNDEDTEIELVRSLKKKLRKVFITLWVIWGSSIFLFILIGIFVVVLKMRTN